MAILALNCGSSSVKFGVFDHTLHRKRGRTIEGRGDAAVTQALTEAKAYSITGVGYRIVHGGPAYADPVPITASIRKDIAALADWAPQHQPAQLRALDIAMTVFPDAQHVACFDTAFHRRIPRARQEMALPPDYAARGLIRYGFHGLSCQHVAETVQAGRIICCHLGNGCSVTAIENGKSVYTSMGFTPVDGLVMGTRSGTLDPGSVLWLVEELGSTDKVRTLINRESGLRGISCSSSDMRDLLAATDSRAQFAVEMFIDRLVLEIGRAAAALQGVEKLVFSGGIGENAAPIRAATLQRLAWLGFELDSAANERNASVISRSANVAMIVKAEEELVIARAVLNRLR
jgi:acetate kinase